MNIFSDWMDLRSDTVTLPTFEMRNAIDHVLSVPDLLGDDVMEEDPTCKKLERLVADMLKKDAALFFPSGTMANLASLLTWCPQRGSEVVIGDKSHIYLYEQAGACQFGQLTFRPIPQNKNGTFTIQSDSLLKEEDIHEPITRLVCVENTHNGVVLPIEFVKHIHHSSFFDGKKIPIHMDGARLWNASVKMGCPVSEWTQYVDSVTVCLSKGLGAPIGSLLAGPSDFIAKARRIRKGLGGGMRQVGVICAAGLVALESIHLLHNNHTMREQFHNTLFHHVAYKDFPFPSCLFDKLRPLLKNKNDENQNDENKNDENKNDENKNDENKNDENKNDENQETNMLFLHVKDVKAVQTLFLYYHIRVGIWDKDTIRLVFHN
jgi:threonine aldolase